MTEKENNQEPPELELPTEDQVEAFGNSNDDTNSNNGGVPFDDSDPGADMIQKLQDELKDAEKRVLMAQADLENFRRRVRRESQDQIKFASSGLMTDLLESVDNLHRAVEAFENDGNGEGLRDGVKLVTAQIMDALSKRDCKPIQAEGQAFDPNLHQALQMKPSEDHPANTVIQDLRTGYQLHDRVLRPSQVFVSTGKA